MASYFKFGRLKSKSLYYLFFGVILLILCWELLLTNDNVHDINLPQEKNLDYVKEAKTRSEVKNAAVAFLALGAQANQLNCPAAIESLVRYGGWSGHVYLITDRTDCFDHDTIVKNADMENSKLHIKKADGKYTGGFDFFSEVGSRVMRMKSKAMKTKLFDFVDEKSIDTIAFIDCDVLVGQPQCISDMLEEHSDWTNHTIKFSHITRLPNDRLVGLHSGVIIAHKEHSKQPLKIWEEELLQLKYIHDRDAYLAAYDKKQLELEGKIQPLDTISSWKHLLPQKNDTQNDHFQWFKNPLKPYELTKRKPLFTGDDYYEKFFNPNVTTVTNLPLIQDPIYCMNHISKVRCGILGRKRIQRYVDRFRLKTYEGKYHYCTHEQIAPLQYGWFPFDMVPFCPKLETLM